MDDTFLQQYQHLPSARSRRGQAVLPGSVRRPSWLQAGQDLQGLSVAVRVDDQRRRRGVDVPAVRPSARLRLPAPMKASRHRRHRVHRTTARPAARRALRRRRRRMPRQAAGHAARSRGARGVPQRGPAAHRRRSDGRPGLPLSRRRAVDVVFHLAANIDTDAPRRPCASTTRARDRSARLAVARLPRRHGSCMRARLRFTIAMAAPEGPIDETSPLTAADRVTDGQSCGARDPAPNAPRAMATRGPIAAAADGLRARTETRRPLRPADQRAAARLAARPPRLAGPHEHHPRGRCGRRR